MKKGHIPTREEFETWLQEQEPRARVVAKEYGTHVERLGNGICDFCSASLAPNARVFDANSVVIEAKTSLQKMVIGDYLSIGGWGACDTCAAFIDAGDRAGLLKRGIAEHVKARPYREKFIRESITVAQAAFWSGRKD